MKKQPDYPDPDLVDLLVPNPTPELMCKIMNDPNGPVQLFTKGKVRCMSGEYGVVIVRCEVPTDYENPYGVVGSHASKYFDRFAQPHSVEELRLECWDIYQNFWKDT